MERGPVCMNEQYQKLLKESTYDVLGVKQVDQKQFAELIVRECLRLCDQVDLAGADDCIDNIKDYFGIK